MAPKTRRSIVESINSIDYPLNPSPLAADTLLGTRASDGATVAVRVDALPSGNGGTASARPPALAATAITITDGGIKDPYWLSADRRTLYAGGTNTLSASTDDGATWATVHGGFPSSIIGVRELANGEFLVSTAAQGGTPGSLYLSSGYPRLGISSAVTWTKVLDAGAGGVGPSSSFDGNWGMSAHGNIVVVSEYGLQNPPTDSARFVYISQDYGATWTQIFDLGTAASAHTHGVCYDPWWDAIWLVNGDTAANRNVRVSWDRGATWNLVPGGTAIQYVGIIALPSCVLLTTDGPTNGVYRISRTNGRASLVIETAYLINGAVGQSHVGGMPYQARGVDAPVLLPFFTGSLAGYGGVVLATYDGYTFTTLYQDTHTYLGKGPQKILGPTVNGNLVGTMSDDRQANNSRITFAAPPSRVRDGIAGERTVALNAALAALTPIGSSAASGAYFLAAPSSSKTASTRSSGNLYLTPLYLPRACTLDQIGVEITVAGTAGATVRLGVWAADPQSGLPTTLLLDAGTIDGTLTGFLAATIALNVGPGLLWIGAAIQGAPATAPTLRLHTGALTINLPASTATVATQGTALGYIQTGVTGAFAASFVNGGPNGLPIVVAVRVKA